MAGIVMPYACMTYIHMTYAGMAGIVMTYIGMANKVMATGYTSDRRLLLLIFLRRDIALQLL